MTTSYRIENDVDENGFLIKEKCNKCGKLFSSRGLRTHASTVHHE